MYSEASMRTTSRTIEAEIVSKRAVKVDTSKGVGTAAGAALGAVAGSSFGSSGRENIAGAIIGTVVGSAAGSAIESNASIVDAFEYILKADVAGLITVLQIDNQFEIGEKVYVILGSRPTIVRNAKSETIDSSAKPTK